MARHQLKTGRKVLFRAGVSGGIFLFLACSLIGVEAQSRRPLDPANVYVLPQGAGNKDGSSWANALDASQANLQSTWDTLPAGGILWIGSGAYSKVSLKLSGGAPDKFKILSGFDTGDGLPVLTGDFTRTNPKTGFIFANLAPGATHLTVRDLKLKDYSIGVYSRGGRHSDIRITNVDVTGCREGISLSGGATKTEPTVGSHGIMVADCDFLNFTKRGIRLQDGNSQVHIFRCTADAGGEAWATEPFQMGFQVGGGTVGEHNISFVECVAQRSFDNQGGDPKKYWNGDGFCAESGTSNLTYTRCRAYNNTDGGWDDKSTNATLKDCVALRNKRNYRFWGTVRLENCLSAFPVHYGGSGGASAIWARGTVTANRCTLYTTSETSVVLDKGTVLLNACIISQAAAGGSYISGQDGGGVVTPTNSVFWRMGQEGNPEFINPNSNWDGTGTNFDSRKYGAHQGYSNQPR